MGSAFWEHYFTTFNPYTDPERAQNTLRKVRNDRTEVVHQYKQASKADFRLKL